MSRDGERMIELVNELASRVGHLVTGMVPPAAQVHLLNAQRELITALMIVYEHRVSGAPTGRAAGRTPGRRAPGRSRTSKRVGKIPIE